MNIQRYGFSGIDNDMFNLLKRVFDDLSERMIYHNNNDLFQKIYDRLFLLKTLEKKMIFELKRNEDQFSIYIDNNSLELFHIKLIEPIRIDFSEEQDELEIYHYQYLNNKEGYPTIDESGDYEIFSENFYMSTLCTDIDNIAIQ